jgi:predicted Zn-dependent protease
MRKVLVFLGLALVIVFSYSFITIRYLASNTEPSYFNQNIRPKLSKHPSLRQVFGLHFDGDAKYNYLGKSTNEIFLEVDQAASAAIDHQVISKLADQISKTSGKKVNYILSDNQVESRGYYSPETLHEIEKEYRDFHFKAEKPVLYVLILDQEEPDSTILGSTFGEDAIVIYTQALSNFVVNYEDSFEKYFLSTGLHEFGHQLGLPHNDLEGCLMSVNAEADHMPKHPWQIVEDFCSYEKELIRTAIK